MDSMVPISAWAKAHGLSHMTALNMARAGKLPGAKLAHVMTERWYVPENARPDYTDRRYKSARQWKKPDARSA